MASRFKDLDVSVEDFISEQENESTKKKTLQNVAKDKQEEYEPKHEIGAETCRNQSPVVQKLITG